MANIAVIIPSWNARAELRPCIDSLVAQSHKANIIVVENGSIDGSADFIKTRYPDVTLLEQPKNLGFAGGVNVGIKKALENGVDYVALFNNDAVADKDWLKNIAKVLDTKPMVGIATSKIMDIKKEYLDSTGDFYTTWGLPYPRGRGEPASSKYDKQTEIFAASGGASLYRAEMLENIGLFDEAFFAYYEDVDLSFRAQLAGWKVNYEPTAIVYHQIGATSSKIKGFTTYQTMKNLPMLGRKNVPFRLLPHCLPRFWLAYLSFFFSATARGQFLPAFRGWFMSIIYLPGNLVARHKIQKNRQVSVDYINKMLVHDLPPNATKLRNLRDKWWQLTRRKSDG